MRRLQALLVWTLVVAIAALPSVALADMILPAFFFAVPGMALLLVPIVVLEGLVLLKWLELGWGTALRVSFMANLVSTFIGIPFSWLAFALVDGAVGLLASRSESVPEALQTILYAGWLGNRESGSRHSR